MAAMCLVGERKHDVGRHADCQASVAVVDAQPDFERANVALGAAHIALRGIAGIDAAEKDRAIPRRAAGEFHGEVVADVNAIDIGFLHIGPHPQIILIDEGDDRLRRVDDFSLQCRAHIDHAIELTNGIQGYQGRGHSCGIYSTNDENIMKLANQTYTSRVMVNQPQAPSNSGNLWNGMRQTFSLGCGSWGGNATNSNISWRDLINETWVSKPLATPKVVPSDEELFGKDIIDALA